jgi:hypothetical protein
MTATTTKAGRAAAAIIAGNDTTNALIHQDLAVEAIKTLVPSRVTKRDAAAIEETVERLTDIWGAAAARAGIAAFFEKRPAPWVG